MTDYDKIRDAETEAGLRARLEGLVPETVKKLALAGVGALFMTEEGIRGMVSELKLPRDAVTNLLAQTEKARTDLFKMIAVEVRRFLEHSNLPGELAKALTGITVDVQASISFRENEEGKLLSKVEGAVKRKAKVKEKAKEKEEA